MTNQEFYNLLDQAGHRLGNLAKNNPAYAFELRKLIEHLQNEATKKDQQIAKLEEHLEMDRQYLAYVCDETEAITHLNAELEQLQTKYNALIGKN